MLVLINPLKHSVVLNVIIVICIFFYTYSKTQAQTQQEVPVFTEDFSPPEIDWQLQSNENRKVSISNSLYHFEHIGSDVALLSAREIPIIYPENHIISTRIKLIYGNGAGYGLIFGYLNAQNFHTFNISSNGYLRYGYYKNGKYYEPIPWTLTGRIVSGDFNNLKVEVEGNRVQFFINNFSVASSNYEGPFGEKVGFIVYSKQKIDIDNLILFKKELVVSETPITTKIITQDLERPEETYKDYEFKYALVVGNSDYSDMPLKNPVNDANAISNELEGLGFEVIKVINADRVAFKNAIREFNAKLSKNPGVGLFYYAGHGLQMNGINYLVPVNADIQEEYEIEDECIPADLVLKMLSYNENPMNIIILDACRNNPFARSFRSAERGLAQPQAAPTGSIVAFATAPGRTASDGGGVNGLYTQELIKAMKVPDLTIEEVFKQVRISVDKLSGGDQIPWENSSLMGDFYFRKN